MRLYHLRQCETLVPTGAVKDVSGNGDGGETVENVVVVVVVVAVMMTVVVANVIMFFY